MLVFEVPRLASGRVSPLVVVDVVEGADTDSAVSDSVSDSPSSSGVTGNSAEPPSASAGAGSHSNEASDPVLLALNASRSQ